MVPKLKNCASFAMSSALRAPRGTSIIVPNRYLIWTFFSVSIRLWIFSTTAFWCWSSEEKPTSGTMISGMTFVSTAASKMARVCISVISGYVMPSLQPLCPNKRYSYRAWG